MGVEGELEMVQRHIRRATELVERQRERVKQLKGARNLRLARELLHELETALELHKQHLDTLKRRSGCGA